MELERYTNCYQSYIPHGDGHKMVWIDFTSGMIVMEELPSIVGFETFDDEYDAEQLLQALNCEGKDKISSCEGKKHHTSNLLSTPKGEQAVSSDVEEGEITDDDDEPFPGCTNKGAELYSLMRCNNEDDGEIVDPSWSGECEEGEIIVDSGLSCKRDKLSNLFSSHKGGKVVSFALEDGEILD